LGILYTPGYKILYKKYPVIYFFTFVFLKNKTKIFYISICYIIFSMGGISFALLISNMNQLKSKHIKKI